MKNSEQKPIILIPERGQRALIVGQTGSGKTAFACWLLKRIEQSPIIIYDTKSENKFENLKNSIVVSTMTEASNEYENGESDYIIVRPSLEYVDDPDAMDQMLLQHYHHFSNCPAYIDETYSFHKSGRAGPGLVALLTRGRSRGITCILSTQRPAWLSMFALTEVQKFYIFKLKHKDDKKRMANVIDGFEELPKLPPHHFYFSDDDHEKPIVFPPVQLDAGLEQGYTISDSGHEIDAEQSSNRRVIWI